MNNIYDTIESPLITEKGSVLSEKQSKYFFRVAVKANKQEIKESVEKIFNVKVKSVNTMNMLGKNKRLRASAGKTPDWKKAIVTLKEGQKIDFTK